MCLYKIEIISFHLFFRPLGSIGAKPAGGSGIRVPPAATRPAPAASVRAVHPSTKPVAASKIDLR